MGFNSGFKGLKNMWDDKQKIWVWCKEMNGAGIESISETTCTRTSLWKQNLGSEE